MTDAPPDAAFDCAVVLGAGAVGSFLGARLSAVVPTVLVGRAAHVEAIRRQRGLRLTGLLDETVAIEAATEMPRPLPCALVVVGVKTGALPDAAAILAERASGGTTVLCIQNGLDPDARMREELARHGRSDLAAARALVSAGCNLVRPGEVECWGGGLAFPDVSAARGVARLFESAGVPVEVVPDFDRAVWLKFAVNCVANPLAAILGARNREIVAPELAALRRAVAEEVRLCARDAGVELGEGLAELVDRGLAASGNRNSMHQDLAYGRPTEIGDLDERVVEMSRLAGRQAPASATLARLVRFLERRRA